MYDLDTPRSDAPCPVILILAPRFQHRLQWVRWCVVSARKLCQGLKGGTGLNKVRWGTHRGGYCVLRTSARSVKAAPRPERLQPATSRCRRWRLPLPSHSVPVDTMEASHSANAALRTSEEKSVGDGDGTERGAHAVRDLDAASATVWAKMDLVVLPLIAIMFCLASIVSASPFDSKSATLICVVSGPNEHWECSDRRVTGGSWYDGQPSLSGSCSNFRRNF